jgi:hypothetical protein
MVPKSGAKQKYELCGERTMLKATTSPNPCPNRNAASPICKASAGLDFADLLHSLRTSLSMVHVVSAPCPDCIPLPNQCKSFWPEASSRVRFAKAAPSQTTSIIVSAVSQPQLVPGCSSLCPLHIARIRAPLFWPGQTATRERGRQVRPCPVDRRGNSVDMNEISPLVCFICHPTLLLDGFPRLGASGAFTTTKPHESRTSAVTAFCPHLNFCDLSLGKCPCHWHMLSSWARCCGRELWRSNK